MKTRDVAWRAIEGCVLISVCGVALNSPLTLGVTDHTTLAIRSHRGAVCDHVDVWTWQCQTRRGIISVADAPSVIMLDTGAAVILGLILGFLVCRLALLLQYSM